ncbi:hypothetical protein [Methylobacterium pseudosasicola]|uniref:hypothetical protein n=1 Tax=Methylobacterium pseudosasicola TaxID=582667 RepID=UPI0011138EB5|nr:hypothetical protein [Methylobacterium pseudosasicola]
MRTATHLIMVVYYDTYIENMVSTIKKLCYIGGISDVVIVNNNNISGLLAVAQKKLSVLNIDVVEHDNSGAEFGAYQAGLNHLIGKDLGQFNLVIANETLGKHYMFFNQHASAFFKSFYQARHGAVACGFVAYAEKRLRIGELYSSRWLQSNLIGLSYSAIERLDFQLYNESLNKLVLSSSAERDMFDVEIGRELADRLRDWLFRPVGGWYGASPLNKGNANFFRNKARSIIQEMHLSMRLEDRDVAIVHYRITFLQRLIIRLKLPFYFFVTSRGRNIGRR